MGSKQQVYLQVLAGDVHDIGKASQHFQSKLSPAMAGQMLKDDVRH